MANPAPPAQHHHIIRLMIVLFVYLIIGYSLFLFSLWTARETNPLYDEWLRTTTAKEMMFDVMAWPVVVIGELFP